MHRELTQSTDVPFRLWLSRSLRLYAKDASENIAPQEKRDTLCPHRFLERGKIFAWSGEHILKDPSAAVVPEVPDYPADKLEIVAPVSVRDTLRLSDGDHIPLQILIA